MGARMHGVLGILFGWVALVAPAALMLSLALLFAAQVAATWGRSTHEWRITGTRRSVMAAANAPAA